MTSRKYFIMNKKFNELFYPFIHITFITGFVYAFYFYFNSPKSTLMVERRLWAKECWTIISWYGVFIYLFLLDKSAEERTKGMKKLNKIKKSVIVNSSKTKLVKWFSNLSQEPSAYSFDSHEGIFPINGDLTKKGSTFATKEKFSLFTLKLMFEVIHVDQDKFEFQLVQPLKILNIAGSFDIKKLSRDKTRLSLSVYSNGTVLQKILSLLLFLSPARFLVGKQIRKEVEFVKSNLEM